jgi:hypothetical protein
MSLMSILEPGYLSIKDRFDFLNQKYLNKSIKEELFKDYMNFSEARTLDRQPLFCSHKHCRVYYLNCI